MKSFVTQVFYHGSSWSQKLVFRKTFQTFGKITSLENIGINLYTLTRNYNTLPRHIHVKQSIYRSTNKCFIRDYSKNYHIKDILKRRHLIDFNNYHKARFLLKAQSVLDNPRASGSGSGGSVSLFRECNDDMVRAMERIKLPDEVTPESDVFTVTRALDKINHDILEYYRSIKTNETIYTKRKRIMVYSDEEMEAEADEYSGRLITAWKRIEKKKNQKYVLPERNPYYENIMGKAMKMHIELKVQFPDKISNRLDHWKIFVFDDPTIFQAMVMMNGHIYISKRLIDSVSDQHLAFVLGHEMSHAYLKHQGEQHSLKDFYNGFTWTVMCNIEKAVPSWTDAAKILLIKRFQQMLLKEFPVRTEHEKEADHMGLYLTSKARVDPILNAEFFKVVDETVPDEAYEAFNEIDGHFKDFEIHYKCPSEPEIKPQWMKDYVRSMQKWDVEHPDITVRTKSLRSLLEKMVPVKAASDDAVNEWKTKTGRKNTHDLPGSMQ